MIEYYKDSSPVVEPEGHIKVLKWILLMVQASVVILRHIFLETPHRALTAVKPASFIRHTEPL